MIDKNSEKIIHSRGMRDYLLKNGGILKKTKKDLKNHDREIYIFDKDSVVDLMDGYKRGSKD